MEAIEQFIAISRKPAVQEEGERLILLADGNYSITERPDAVLLEAWNEQINLVRRIKAIQRQRPGRLDLTIERFGKRTGVLTLVDLEHSAGAGAERVAIRREFREQFARFLRRRFTDWRIAELSTEPDLEHSLSPAFPRALLRRGAQALAAMGATGASAPNALAFGLIWLDYLRRREPGLAVEGLVLYEPLEHIANTCLRLRWLNPEVARLLVFAHGPAGLEEAIDPQDYGNVDTRLEPCPGPSRRALQSTPEARLESLIRQNLPAVSAALAPAPVYGQVPSLAGLDRGVLDLLAVSHDGRLAVLELKATQNLQLPVQALDYWLRVAWHAARDEFRALGYFPGFPLRTEPPRLFLVAPAIQFHPTTETILRFYSPSIEVERVGLALPWENEIRVLFRARGAAVPGA
jgi:hypothetical protein